MSWWSGGWWGNGASSDDGGPVGIADGTATLETIRDRMIALIVDLTPTSLAADKFRVGRDELKADFPAQMEAAPQASLRRFTVRTRSASDDPLTSSVDVTMQEAEATIIVAYPQTHRYGPGAGRDRFDIMDEDWRKINRAIGPIGRGNFSSTNDCTPLKSRHEFELGTAVDFLVITIELTYHLDTDG